MAFDKTRFLARFIEEAREHCSKMSSGLLEIEKNPADDEGMNAVFRSAHTVKGGARMMKLAAIAELTHRLEDALDALRSGKVPLSKEVMAVLFRAVDEVAALVGRAADGDTAGEAPAEIMERLEVVARGEMTGAATAAPPPSKPAPPASPPFPLDKQPAERSARAESVRVHAAKLDALVNLMGEVVSSHRRMERTLGRWRELEQLAARAVDARESDRGRVRELATGLRQVGAAMRNEALLHELLIGELQEVSLKMRMLPLATVFDTFPRTVRDLALATGKEVDFIVEGGETELDKKIVEKIGDPLLHMIRNALDHGIGTAEERQASGKPGRGTVRLSAGYERGCVTIVVQDDGRGIPLRQVAAKAVQKKLIEEGAIAALSDRELIEFIFHPGFSTSPIITDLSGRGVGMDVVRQTIVEELQGSIRVETREGEGTAFFIRLPLNLAIFRLLLVTAGGRTLALPATVVSEIVAVPRGELIQVVNRQAIRLREQLIPVEALDSILNLPPAGPGGAEALVLIVHAGQEKLGLIADALVDEEDMVVKPLPPLLKNNRLVTGVAIGGGNEIINVLQVPALLKAARERREGHVQPTGTAAGRRELTILVVDDSPNTRDIEKDILEAYGYRVVLAEDGAEALEKAGEAVFDAVITDVEMPRLDGFSLTERLRRDARYRDTPIIIVTSREKDEDKRRGIAAGANAYIVKGTFEQSNLLETLQYLVG